MQMVYQDPYGSLNPRMTIRNIVGEPLAVHGLDGDKAATRDKIAVADRLRRPVARHGRPLSA